MLACGLLLGLSSAAQAGQVPGARYDGVGGKPAKRQYATVSKDGRRLSRYFVILRGSCSDGKRYTSFVNQLREPRAAIGADGSISKPAKNFTGPIRYRGKRFRATISDTLSGSFSATGDQVTIVSSLKLVSKRVRCTARGQITLSRDGTPEAPLTDDRMLSGKYGGARARGLVIEPFRTLAPGGEVQNFALRYRARCSTGPDYKNRFTVKLFLLSLRDTFDAPDTYTGRTRDGYRYRARDRLTLRFAKQGDAYVYRGSYRVRLVFTRKGERASTCVLPTTRFSGRAG